MNKKKLFLAVPFLLAVSFPYSNCFAEVRYNADFPEKIQDFLLSQPIQKTSFTGKEDGDLKETYPFFTDPLSNYALTFDSKSQSFSPGETVSLSSKLKFNFQGEATLKKDCPTCQNSTIYPISEIPDTGIFVQVWRKDNDKTGALKGDYLIDEFYAISGVTLRENEEKEFNVNWKIPSSEKAGDYYFSFFVNSGKRFNLKGTPLVAFYPADNFNFHLKGDESLNGVELDKNNININGKTYAYREPAPTLDSSNEISVSIPLTNLSKGGQNIKVAYDLLGWGQEDEKDLILPEKTENITLDSGEKKDLVFSFNPDEINSVYNLKITASASDSKSVSNVRFVLKGKNRGLIRFLGMAKNQNNLAPLFCIRNAQWQGTFNGKFKLTATVDGKEIANLEKSGDFTTEDRCFLITNASLALKNTKGLILKGEVFNKDNKLVDQRLVTYTSKSVQNSNTIGSIVSNDYSNSKKIILLLIALVLVITGYLIYRKINNQPYAKK